MSSNNLLNLVGPGKLKEEAPNAREFAGLVNSARLRLHDAHNTALSPDSRFDLAYNASHALALAALRHHGYRSDNHYLVFPCLPHTVGAGPEIWRVLDKCHHQRNLAEYAGHLEVDQALLDALLRAADWLADAVEKLPAIAS